MGVGLTQRIPRAGRGTGSLGLLVIPADPLTQLPRTIWLLLPLARLEDSRNGGWTPRLHSFSGGSHMPGPDVA